MRVVLDTNILVSGLLITNSLPATLIDLWRDRYFELVTSREQLAEIMRATRYPKIRERLAPALAGRLINDLRDLAILIDKIPTTTICADPDDDYLLGMAVAGAADFLVTGDKRDLLGLARHEGTRVVSVRPFLEMIRRLP